MYISKERLQHLEYIEANLSAIVESAVQEYHKSTETQNKQKQQFKGADSKENRVQSQPQTPKDDTSLSPP